MDMASGPTHSNGAPEPSAPAAVAAEAASPAPIRVDTGPRESAVLDRGAVRLPAGPALLPVGPSCPLYTWSPAAPNWGDSLVLTAGSPASPFLPTNEVFLLYGPDPTQPVHVDDLTANTSFSGSGQTATVKLPAAPSSTALPYWLRVDVDAQQPCGPNPISIGGSVILSVDLDAIARSIAMTVNGRAATPTVGEFAGGLGIPATPYQLSNYNGMPDTIEVGLELANGSLLPTGFGLVGPQGVPVPAVDWFGVMRAIPVEELRSWIDAVDRAGDGRGDREKALQVAATVVRRVSAQLSKAVAASRTAGPLRHVFGAPSQPAVPITVDLTWTVYDSRRDTYFTAQETPVFGAVEDHAAAFAAALLHLRALHFVEDRLLDPSQLPALNGAMTVEVEFSLSLGDQRVGPYGLSLPVVVPPLPLPTVAVFCSNTLPDGPISAENVQSELGRVFFMLPGNSALANLNVLALKLATVAGALDQLGSLVSLVAFLAGVSDVASILSGVTDVGYIQYRIADQVNDLEDVVFVPKGIFDFDTDVDADDRFRSLLFLGVPASSRHTIQVFNENDFSNDEGEFDVVLADFAVRVPDFGVLRQGSEPEGVTVVRDAAADWVFQDASFSAQASSLRFGRS